jgi:hypothetical protein
LCARDQRSCACLNKFDFLRPPSVVPPPRLGTPNEPGFFFAYASQHEPQLRLVHAKEPELVAFASCRHSPLLLFLARTQLRRNASAHRPVIPNGVCEVRNPSSICTCPRSRPIPIPPIESVYKTLTSHPNAVKLSGESTGHAHSSNETKIHAVRVRPARSRSSPLVFLLPCNRRTKAV